MARSIFPALVAILLASRLLAGEISPVDRDFFESKVRPILVEKCLGCHSAEKKIRGGLRLDSQAGWAKGGDSGPALTPGKPDESLLIEAIGYGDASLAMPPTGKLPADTIATLTEWVKRGAPDPRLEAPAPAKRVIDIAQGKTHWAFQRLKPVPIPSTTASSWIRNPIDAFILAKLETSGLGPATEANRSVLIRRLNFDLIGLPPTSEEVEGFVKDPTPDAYETLVARLLASPRHGERWARHWLDLARFAESHGFEHDYDRLTAYTYRDFVIEALNRDLPYDTFVRWQIAGDELAPDDNLALKATGLLAAGVHSTQITANQVEKERYDELDDLVATTGTAFLGLTIGCARCHDHKYDPIPQSDYYRLVSTFTTTVRTEYDLKTDPAGDKARLAVFTRELATRQADLATFEATTLPNRFAAWESTRSSDAPLPPEVELILKSPQQLRTDGQNDAILRWYRGIEPDWLALRDKVADQTKVKPIPTVVKALISSEGLPAVRLHTQGGDFLDKTHFLKRGDPNQKQEEATQSFLQVLMNATESKWQAEPPKGWRTSYRRIGLANWLTDTNDGAGHLLARVMVNRLWQHHFGRGLVATPSDFGTMGEKPTHPELLDWLANQLIENGWRLKPIHTLIVTSAAYRQAALGEDSSNTPPEQNEGLFRGRPKQRLEAEAIRDALLAVSGQLDTTMYGPGTLEMGIKRRSIYLTVKRSQLVPMMVLFDAPEALQGVGLRQTTTVAPQSLLLLNSPIVRAWAKGFAEQVQAKSGQSPDLAVMWAYKIALGRDPAPDEKSDGAEFLSGKDAIESSLIDFCQTLMSLNEFIFIE